MKRLLLIALLAGLMTTAYAQTTPAPVEPAAPAASATQDTDAVGQSLVERNCIRSTGSRIVEHQNAKRAKDQPERCNGLPGRSYSRQDLERTGQVDLKDALRTLDPAIR